MTGGIPFDINSTEVYIRLNRVDTNRLKQISMIATSSANTYITVTNLTIADMNDNNNAPVEDGKGVRADNFTDDVTAPFLLTFSLNLTSEELILTFSETVSATSIDMSQFIFHSAPHHLPTISYRLTGRIVVTPDSPEIAVTLTRSDLNELKKYDKFAVMRLPLTSLILLALSLTHSLS